MFKVRHEGAHDDRPGDLGHSQGNQTFTETVTRELDSSSNLLPNHKRRINTEEKAKFVAAVWGTEFIKFFAARKIFCTMTILRIGRFILLLK